MEFSEREALSSDKWNLLELPKPINTASAALASVTITAKQVNNDKKPTATSLPNKRGGATVKQKSPVKMAPKVSHGPPAYVDVLYVPAHGNGFCVDTEFFRRVCARYYVLSTIEPSQNVLNAIMDAKQSWEDKNAQVT
jgi:hypothetical protein